MWSYNMKHKNTNIKLNKNTFIYQANTYNVKTENKRIYQRTVERNEQNWKNGKKAEKNQNIRNIYLFFFFILFSSFSSFFINYIFLFVLVGFYGSTNVQKTKFLLFSFSFFLTIHNCIFIL